MSVEKIEEVLRLGREILEKGDIFFGVTDGDGSLKGTEEVDRVTELIDLYSHKVQEIIDDVEAGAAEGGVSLLQLSDQYKEVVGLAERMLERVGSAIDHNRKRIIELKKRQTVHKAYLQRVGSKRSR